MLQRSDEWFEMRKGRFTASNIVRLLGKETLKKTKDSIDNFAFEKAVEVVFGLEDLEDEYLSKDIQRGVELEPLAFEKFKELKKLDFLNVEECSFFPFGEHAGASPDGLVDNDAILEIKCPRRNKFYKIVATNEIDSKYYAQMQMQMLCTNSIKCYFFNYIIDNGVEKWHEIEVLRDNEMIAVIKERIKLAIEIKKEYINKLNENKQF